MFINLLKSNYKTALLAIAGVAFTALELSLINGGSKRLLLVPFLLVPVFFSILYSWSFPLFFVASTFFVFGVGIPTPSWTYLGISDFGFLVLILFYLGDKYKPEELHTKVVTTIKNPNNGVFYMLLIFSAITLFSQLTIIASLNESDLLRALIFAYHSIQLPIAFKILSRFFKYNSTVPCKKIVLFLMVFQIILVFLQYFMAIDNNSDDNMPHGTYMHHAMIGNIMLISISWCVAFFLTTRKRVLKIVFGVSTLSSLLAIIFSASRSAITGLAIAFAIFALVNFKLSKKFIFFTAFSIVTLAGLFILTPLKHIIEHTFHSTPVGIDVSSFGRLWIWMGGWEYFLHAPWYIKLFGHGMGQYTLIPYRLWIQIGKFTSGAHNNLLHVLIETGIIGLVAFLSLFFVILKELWKQGKNNSFSRYFFYSTIALLGSGFTQETFWFQSSFGSFWLFYICCLAIVLAHSGENKLFLKGL